MIPPAGVDGGEVKSLGPGDQESCGNDKDVSDRGYRYQDSRPAVSAPAVDHPPKHSHPPCAAARLYQLNDITLS